MADSKPRDSEREGTLEPGIAFFITRIDKPGSRVRDRTDHVGKYILERPLENNGLTLMRADQDPNPNKITEKIVNHIINARLVIVDATGGSPNVFYELGLAHAFQKPVILLIDSLDGVPFDVSEYTFIEIGDDGKVGAAEADAASERFERSLEQVLRPNFVPSSPVTAANARAQLEASEDPGELGLAEVLKRLDVLGVDIQRSRGSYPPRTRDRFDMSFDASGIEIRDRVRGISWEVSSEGMPWFEDLEDSMEWVASQLASQGFDPFGSEDTVFHIAAHFFHLQSGPPSRERDGEADRPPD